MKIKKHNLKKTVRAKKGFKGIPVSTLLAMYQNMVRIRKCEDKLVELYPTQDMKTPIHLCIGQEAIAVGVCLNLKKSDYIFGTHRSHGHYLAKGGSLGLLMAECYGRIDGCSKGKGGSMHLVAPEVGIMGNSAIVGGGISHAVGAALAIVLQKKKDVSVTFFGDGAVDTGAFHESLNFASLKKLPVVFVCENNFYATNSPLLSRQPLDNIYKRAAVYGIPGIRVDGNDIIKVFQVAKKAIDLARRGGGPTLIECRTYRWMQHVGPKPDFEMGCRPKKELDCWMKKCPIKRFKAFLISKKIATKEQLQEIDKNLDKEMEEAVNFGKCSSLSCKDEICKDVC